MKCTSLQTLGTWSFSVADQEQSQWAEESVCSGPAPAVNPSCTGRNEVTRVEPNVGVGEQPVGGSGDEVSCETQKLNVHKGQT